jgi:hypothetical protein
MNTTQLPRDIARAIPIILLVPDTHTCFCHPKTAYL